MSAENTTAEYDPITAAAMSKRDKGTAKRWTEMEKRTAIANFLKSNKKNDAVTVAGKDASYIVTQLNNIIRADNLSGTCYAVEYEGEAKLVNFKLSNPAPVTTNKQ